MKPILLGCIADDFTGATDLANNLVRAGMRVIQTVGVPEGDLEIDVDAVVIALKSRTIAPEVAVEQSLKALAWLKKCGAHQIYFKYCSTFDSTDQGNIGPVTHALMQAMSASFTVVTPAFPDNGRTIFKGHLFVGDVLLSDSSMRNHPLTPMSDSNLVRLMQAQYPDPVGLIDYKVVSKGSVAIKERITELTRQGIKAAVVDALSNTDLVELGLAVKDLPLVTAGSGLAIGLPQNFGLKPSLSQTHLPSPYGHRAILSGSCSEMTLKQVEHFKKQGHPFFALNPMELSRDWSYLDQAVQWARSEFTKSEGPVLIYSTSAPEQVRSVQRELSVGQAGELVEKAMGELARALIQMGVGQLLVAGGETSGVCVQSLKITQLQIGPQIDPGVPWCFARTPSSLHLALKSGNFGREDFFSYAWSVLDQQTV
jgi:uncharacterized protein YgbK (DUF1537 family)